MDNQIREAIEASPFRRQGQSPEDSFTFLGHDAYGGKASGLAFARKVLKESFPHHEFPGIQISIPNLTVLRTSTFDAFMKRNNLWQTLEKPQSDKSIALAFMHAYFPTEYLGDLMSLALNKKAPLAIRSSSMLEDALYQPFAGVYATKMLPNNHPEGDARFRKIIEAVKLVYASTFFEIARDYRNHINVADHDEKMAVIIQDIAGQNCGGSFYPTISGVARSFSYYPIGKAKPEQGIVNLALGLGKTIVDGGISWGYCPRFPKVAPPTASARELTAKTQNNFWSVNLSKVEFYNPVHEDEFLIKRHFTEAEVEGALDSIASVYDAASDRLLPGIHHEGPRVLDFAPILKHQKYPLNKLIFRLLQTFEKALDQAVEIEFAFTIPRISGQPLEFSFLQVRPMMTFDKSISISEAIWESEKIVARSEAAMGNGTDEEIRDIVFVRPETFDPKHSPRIAEEINTINRNLVQQKRPYLLLGFGRWGSSDPWLGIPVAWSQISGAKVIIEASSQNMNVDLSQGSHFFHNLSAFKISYFSIHHRDSRGINWEWIQNQTLETSTQFVNHVRLDHPLKVKVDGRCSKGVVLHG